MGNVSFFVIAFLSLFSAGAWSYGGLDLDLRLASREGNLNEVKWLIKMGARLDSSSLEGDTALHFAARYNRIKVVEYLLSQGADPSIPNFNHETPLIKASRECSYRVAYLLLKGGANVNHVNYEGRSAIHYAAMGGCSRLVSGLLKSPSIKLNRPDDAGNTALDYALEGAIAEVGGPYTEVVQYLKKAGAKSQSFVEVRIAPTPAPEILDILPHPNR